MTITPTIEVLAALIDVTIDRPTMITPMITPTMEVLAALIDMTIDDYSDYGGACRFD